MCKRINLNVCSEIPFSKNPHHTETSKLICDDWFLYDTIPQWKVFPSNFYAQGIIWNSIKILKKKKINREGAPSKSTARYLI